MGSHYTGTDSERLALDSYIKLMRAAESVTSRVAQRLDRHGLTTSQFGVLEALLHLGPLCQRDLAAKILKSTGNLTLIIDNLEKRGLVRRERGSDRRYLTVHLTAAGHTLIADLFPRHAVAIGDELATLSAEEQRELGRLCRKLGRRESPPPCQGDPS